MSIGDIGDMFGGHIPEEPAPKGNFGGGDNFGVKLNPEKMPQALKDGTVTEADVTRAAGRVLYEIVHFGYMNGMQKHDVTAQPIEANAKIIEKTGEDAAVLLKNEGNAASAQGRGSGLGSADRAHRRSGGFHRHQRRAQRWPALARRWDRWLPCARSPATPTSSSPWPTT